MWLIFYKYYKVIFYKQLKYKQFSLLLFTNNWIFFNLKKKKFRILPIFMLLSVFETLQIYQQNSWYFFSISVPFNFIKFFIYKIPTNFQQLVEINYLHKNKFLGVVLNNFFQINKLPKQLFFLTTFKRLKIFWIFQKALLVK